MKERGEQVRALEEMRYHLNISLTLREYNDIFSDFDLRDYSVRSLSVDFLHEAKRAAVDKSESLELNLLVPESKRDPKTEATIKTRLKEHFARHFFLLKKERSKITVKGLIMTFIGVALMLGAGYLLWSSLNQATIGMFLLILLEPAGWFFFWEGLDLVIFKPNDHSADLNFYRKMSQARVRFVSY